MSKFTLIILFTLFNLNSLHSGENLANITTNTNIYSNYLNHFTTVNLDLTSNNFNNLTNLRYSNSGLLSSTSIPEEMFANSQFSYKLTDYFALATYHDLKYNGDAKTNIISLAEFRNLGGIKLFHKNSFAKLYFGKEYQKLLGFDSFSNAGRVELGTNFKFSGYDIKSKYNIDKTKRTFGRNYSLQELGISSEKSFSPSDRMGIYVDYQDLVNDRITSLVSQGDPTIQNEKQKLYGMRTNLSYKLSKNINSRFDFSYTTGKYSKKVPKLNTDEGITQFQNTTNIEDLLRFTNYWNLDLGYLSSKFKVEVNSKNYANSISSSDESQKDLLQRNARDKDKKIFEILIANKFEYEISNTDSVGLDVSYKSTKEDTPSDNENSDSDRLIVGANLYYSKHYSPWFSSVFRLGSRFQHIVWLKKEYSSGNNKLQTLELEAEFDYRYEIIRMKPTIGISVEYVSKDFPSLTDKYSGSVIRRFFVSDSIKISIKEKFPLHIDYFYHYRESGGYDQKSFTQTVDNKKEELILRSLLYYRNKNDDLFGIGMRYFSLKQTIGNSNVNSFGPVGEIVFTAFGNWKLIFGTWLEFRSDGQNGNYTTVPNLNLTTEIGL